MIHARLSATLKRNHAVHGRLNPERKSRHAEGIRPESAWMVRPRGDSVDWRWRGDCFRRSRIMKRILAMAALCLALAGCVYAGPGPSYGYYGGDYGWGASGYPGPPIGERVASPG